MMGSGSTRPAAAAAALAAAAGGGAHDNGDGDEPTDGWAWLAVTQGELTLESLGAPRTDTVTVALLDRDDVDDDWRRIYAVAKAPLNSLWHLYDENNVLLEKVPFEGEYAGIAAEWGMYYQSPVITAQIQQIAQRGARDGGGTSGASGVRGWASGRGGGNAGGLDGGGEGHGDGDAAQVGSGAGGDEEEMEDGEAEPEADDVTPRRKRLREDAFARQEKQGEEMRARATKVDGGLVTTGSVVHVSVANVDRGKLDPTNATLVVVELVKKKKIVLYRVAGRDGVCKDLYARAYVRLLPDVSPAHLGLDTVLHDWRSMPTVPLRTLVTAASATGGQGMQRCSCKGKCDNNKCACSKAGHRCNSRCHKGSTTCTNCYD